MDYSLPGFSVHGILQARILEWVAMPSSKGCSRPRHWTHPCLLHCRWIVYHWTTWEAQVNREEQDSLDHFYLEPRFSTQPLFYPEFISNKDERPNIWKKRKRETEFSFLEIQKMLILSMVNWALEVCLIGPTRCLRWTEAVEFIHAHLRCVLQTTQPECLRCNFLCPDKNVMCKLIYHLPDLLSHDSGYHGIIFRVRQ